MIFRVPTIASSTSSVSENETTIPPLVHTGTWQHHVAPWGSIAYSEHRRSPLARQYRVDQPSPWDPGGAHSSTPNCYTNATAAGALR